MIFAGSYFFCGVLLLEMASGESFLIMLVIVIPILANLPTVGIDVNHIPINSILGKCQVALAQPNLTLFD